MPPKMMIETPLPIPSWVMICPSHMASIVPAVSVRMMATVASGYWANPNSFSTWVPLAALANNEDWPKACSAANGIVKMIVY